MYSEITKIINAGWRLQQNNGSAERKFSKYFLRL